MLNYIDVSNESIEESLLQFLRIAQSEMCESCNEPIYWLVKDNFDSLVRESIQADGRGHFLSLYDGEEYEEYVTNEDNRWYFIYQQ